MGKSAPTPPKPPDPQDVARAQTSSNIGTAIANSFIGNADTTTPLGSVQYRQTGNERIKIDGKWYDIPTWDVTQRLSSDQQRILNLQEMAQQNLGQIAVQQSDKLGKHLGGFIDPNQLPDAVQQARNAPTLQRATNLTPELQMSIGDNDFSADRQRVEEAMYARLNPQLDRQRSAMESRLANQGVTQDSEAYRQAMDELNRGANDLRLQTVLAGGQEQSRLFGMDQAQGQFRNQATQQDIGNRLTAADHFNNVAQNQFGLRNQQDANQQTLRQQQLQEMTHLRNQPLNEVAQLMSGAQPTMPQFQAWNPGTVANTPVGQYHYQSAQLANQNYATQVGQQNAMMGGIFGLGSSALGALPLMFSDKRLKTDIKKVGKADNGLPIFSYRYKGDATPRIGFMAQDVAKKNPEAVAVHESGYLMVDNARAAQPVEA